MTKPRTSKARAKADTKPRNRTAGATAATIGVVVAGAAAGLIAALRFGWLDRLRGAAGGAGAEHPAPDLAADQPHPGPNHRAPEAFRPDPTAPVPASEREALRPPKGVGKGFTDDGSSVEVG